MATLKSWLSQPMSSSVHHPENGISPPSPTLPNPATSALIPPPAASQSLRRPHHQDRERSSNVSRILTLYSSEQRLHRHLQWYLDTQADGLVAGITGDSTSTSGFGSTHRSSFHRGGQTAQQQSRAIIGLSAARIGILSTMKNLAAVKEEEIQRFSSLEIQATIELEKIDAWERKRSALENQLGSVGHDSHRPSIEDLEKQDVTLQDQIEAMELSLSELKSQQKAVHLSLHRVKNSIDSVSSSYKASLSLLDSEVKGFLRNPPLFRISVDSPAAFFHSLPATRRTLPLAKDYLCEIQNEADTYKVGAEKEIFALKDGTRVWEDIIEDITNFETMLRQETSKINEFARLSNHPGVVSGTSFEETVELQGNIRRILERMTSVTLHLQNTFYQAESNGWSLLICCLGAELEAFQQGHQILLQALQISDQSQAGLVKESNTNMEKSDRVTSASPKASTFSTHSTRLTRENDDENEKELDPESLLVSN